MLLNLLDYFEISIRNSLYYSRFQSFSRIFRCLHADFSHFLRQYRAIRRYCLNLLQFYFLTVPYLCTRPEPLPPASERTSFSEDMLKSYSVACFKQEAATANSMIFCVSSGHLRMA